MINKNNSIKTKICINWREGKCKYNNKCNFAHGENDMKKQECLNGIKCYNENCIYNHPKQWNAFDNKRECIFCLDGFCDKSNLKYKHLFDKENKKINNDENVKIPKINNFDEKDFPLLENLENHKKSKKDIDINNFNIKTYNEILDIKKQLYINYKRLSKLDENSWSDDIEIQETNNKINILNEKYIILKNKYKEEYDIMLNEELNLETLYFEDYQNQEDMNNIPNIEITINGIDLNDFDKNEENINKDIDEIEYYINKYINKIKK